MDDNDTPSIVPVLVNITERSNKHPVKPELIEAIHAWREKRRADIHRKVAAGSAREARERYRAERKAEGKIVRPYKFHNHLPKQEDETESDFRRRIHRDRQRTYKAASAQPTRPRADLSTMTPEERADHIRKLATARKQRERNRKDGATNRTTAKMSSPVGDDIEWGMF